MGYHLFYRVRSIFIDTLTGILMFLLVAFVVVAPTMGNEAFVSRYVNNDVVTTKLCERLDSYTDELAGKINIDPNAFKYAVGEDEVKSVQGDLIKSAFNGTNYDYSTSAGIEERYYQGIAEYYDINAMEINQDDLIKASKSASNLFNAAMGISNNSDFAAFVDLLSKGAIAFAVLFAVAIFAICFRTMVICHARTKRFSHYGCSLVCAGLTLVLYFFANLKLDFCGRLYFTDNAAVNYVISNASVMFFMICGICGAIMAVVGEGMIVHVYRYYIRKQAIRQQEREINRQLQFEDPQNDRSTIGQLDFSSKESQE